MRWMFMATCGMILSAGVTNSLRDVGLPSSWLRKWQSPPCEDRPLQIVHGIDPSGRGPAGMAQMVPSAGSDAIAEEGMRYYRDMGLGGVVCNVLFQDYLRSEAAWTALVDAVHAAERLGMIVWIYDEEGYPSGAAGGRVLEGNPEYEAQELAYDPSKPDPFVVRPSYEFTHAANNYYAARRYVNLLDERAVRKFLALTHQAYRRRLGSCMGTTVRAFFTDEPSLLAVNLGQIPESARRNVPIRDALDPTIRPLPAVPWVRDLPERYRERYEQDLLQVRRSLFEGDGPKDKEVRRRFWTLVGDLIAERYFGTIQKWCRDYRVASSGHNLWEEAIMHHPALYGNALKALSRMDIPGMDELSSEPTAVLHGHWMTAALPASAAMLTGGRRVFTEVSDFSEKMGGRGPASLPMMLATAGWQAAFGVTEFTLYYGIGDRSPQDYRSYCAFVGRLNAVLKPARMDPEVLLYYPIRDLMEEYRPVAEPLNIASQSARARRIVGSFNRLGTSLTRAQIPFCLVDDEFLAKAAIRRGRLAIRQYGFRAIVIPDGVELPPSAGDLLERFQAAGGLVLHDAVPQQLDATRLKTILDPAYGLEPATESIVLGRFRRDGRTVVVLVNAGTSAWDGRLRADRSGTWTLLEPASGVTRAVEAMGNAIRVSLQPMETLLLASP